jgi:hypothetical protein
VCGQIRVEMNYLKVYCNLIRKAENRYCPEGYVEKHHIFPKSIFGKNDKIVVLTGREHYIAHILLQKICERRYGLKHKNTQKMLCAHINMKSKGRYFNSYLYENAKVKRSESMRGELHWNWKGGVVKMYTYTNDKKYNKINYYKKKEKFNTNDNYKRYEYELTSPDGNIIKTNSLRKTCDDNGLDHRTMNKVISGKRNHHKGWTGKIIQSLTI